MTPQGGSPLHARALAVRCDRGTVRAIELVSDRCGAQTQVIDDVLAAIVAIVRWSPGLVLLPVAEATDDLVTVLRAAGRFELVLLGNASPGKADTADAVLALPLSAAQLALHIALAASLPPSLPPSLPTRGLPVRTVGARCLRVGRVELDLLSRTVVVVGRPGEAHLTGRESALLHDLMEHVGQLRTREELLLAVWQIDFQAKTTVVEVTVSRLRAKTHLEELRTLRTGYRFTALEASPALKASPAVENSRTALTSARAPYPPRNMASGAPGA